MTAATSCPCPRARAAIFWCAAAVVPRTEVREDVEAALRAKKSNRAKKKTNILDAASAKTILTESKPKDFPSPLRQKLSSVQVVERHKVQGEATTTETCPKCSRTEVRFSTAQTRGADEGSTVFFHCDCGYRYVYCRTWDGRRSGGNSNNWQMVAQQLSWHAYSTSVDLSSCCNSSLSLCP